jgi:hypothetical protein
VSLKAIDEAKAALEAAKVLCIDDAAGLNMIKTYRH